MSKRSHWAALEFDENQICLCDSMLTSANSETAQTIGNLYSHNLLKTKDASFHINIMNVEKHTGTVDCALYAIATITALLLNEDPTAIIFNQAELRPHFINVLETKTLTKFPILKVKHRITNRISYIQQCFVYGIC